MLSPALPLTLSMMRTSPTETFSWRPPARTIAYTWNSLSYFGRHALSVWTGRQLPASSPREGCSVRTPDGGRTKAQDYRVEGSPTKPAVVRHTSGRPAGMPHGSLTVRARLSDG
ncbi:hypothetical protein GCM10009845_08140 [Pedococcus bigeumensis]